MTEEESFDVLKTIAELYPRYELTKRKAQILLPQLQKMEYDGVLKKLSAYVAEHPHAPTIAEIAVYPPEENKHLKMMKEWQAEADKVSEETKQQFRLQMQQLLGKFVSNEHS